MPEQSTDQQTIDRHRDELSPAGRNRADNVFHQIQGDLNALGVTQIDELTGLLRQGSISSEQALAVMANMKRLDAATEPGLPYQVTREVLDRPENPDISRIAWLPDATVAIRFIDSDGFSSIVKVIDPVTNTTVHESANTTCKLFYDMTGLPDGRLISYAGNTIWDPESDTGTPVFPPDSPYLFSLLGQKTVTLKRPDGSLVFVIAETGEQRSDYQTILYDVASSEAKWVPLPEFGTYILQDITPEGHYLLQSTVKEARSPVTWGKTYGIISEWDPLTWKETYQTPKIPVEDGNPFTVAKALPDSSGFLIATKTGLKKWETESGVLTSLSIPPIYSDISDVEYFPSNPRYVCVLGENRDQSLYPYTLLIVDLEFNTVEKIIPTHNKVFACSPDGRIFLGGDKNIEMYTFTEKLP